MSTHGRISMSTMAARAARCAALGLTLALLAGCAATDVPAGAHAQPAAAATGTNASAKVDSHAVLAPYEARLAPTRRPALSIALETMHQDDVMASKVGGRAYVPAGKALPRGPDGNALILLAQVDFAHAPRMPGYPETGMLQFFISGDDFYGANFDGPLELSRLAEQRGFRVLYWPAPLAPAAKLEASFPPAEVASLPFDPSRPRRMRFIRGDETIGSGDVGFSRIVGTDVHAMARDYAARHGVGEDAAADALRDALSRAGHKLGGYPFFTQSDPRQPGDGHVLLLQLDTDGQMMWGDSGVANFFILPEDLARRDFSRVAYHWDCL